MGFSDFHLRFHPKVRQLRRGLLEEQDREQETRASLILLSSILISEQENAWSHNLRAFVGYLGNIIIVKYYISHL